MTALKFIRSNQKRAAWLPKLRAGVCVLKEFPGEA